MRPDLVPALGLALAVGTSLLLIVLTNGWYLVCRVHDPRSPLRQSGLSPTP